MLWRWQSKLTCDTQLGGLVRCGVRYRRKSCRADHLIGSAVHDPKKTPRIISP
jgi:hypothetical protein